MKREALSLELSHLWKYSLIIDLHIDYSKYRISIWVEVILGFILIQIARFLFTNSQATDLSFK